MKNDRGFSLIELLIVIAIMAILSTIAIPSFLKWRDDSKLRGAVSNLKGDLQRAKLRAIRENAYTVVELNPNGSTSGSTRYQGFVDNGAGANTRNKTWETDEARFRNRELPPGVTVNLAGTDFTDNKVIFNGRGLPIFTTNVTSRKITIKDYRNKSVELSVNRVGRVVEL